nr:hypothetical protein CFP56_10731 [Quercus suber]
MILSKPSSKANSRALHAAKTSTTTTMDGRGICWDSDAMTRPSLLQMITPRPAILSLAKVWCKGFEILGDGPSDGIG